MENAAEPSHSFDTPPNELYQYDTLPPGEFFRYLVLQPGAGDQSLECALHTSLLADTEFEAISYVWGTDRKNQTILCNQRPLKITPSLNEALLRLRYPDTTRTLWADAICIDQQDPKEKGHQVAMMSQIYKAAKVVLLHVGSDSGQDSHRAASLIREVRDMIDVELGKLGLSAEWDTFPYLEPNHHLLTDTRWSSVEKLLRQKWFRRGWVVREAALARSARIIWGQSEVLWDDVMLVEAWLASRNFYLGLIAKDLIADPHMRTYGDQNVDLLRPLLCREGARSERLLDYISASSLEFTDPRDKIYAFTDLGAEPNGLDLEPDYNCGLEAAFMRFAVEYIHVTKSSELLDYVEHTLPTLQSDLPTWVPNWSSGSSNGFAQDHGSKLPLLSRTGLICEPVTTRERTLNVRGVVLDPVIFVSEIFNKSSTTPEMIAGLWKHIRTLFTLAPYPEANQPEAFLNVLTMAIYRGESQAWSTAAFAYIKGMSVDTNMPGPTEYCGDGVHASKLAAIHNLIKDCTHYLRFLVTSRGYMGLAPAVAREGDMHGIIFGCEHACILRPTEEPSHYTFIGSAFVLGSTFYPRDVYVMEGFWSSLGDEDSKEWVNWDVEEQDIYLV